jgi:hypothetical protein
MRRHKNLLPLTLESVAALMIPGKSYTAAKLSCLFDGSPSAITCVLSTLIAFGVVSSQLADKGRRLDRREDRRIYWIPFHSLPNIAERRQQPAETFGELRGYDLASFQRLCMATRR